MRRLQSMTLFLIMLKLLLVLAGCHRGREEGGVLIIGIAGLKAEDIPCDLARENELRGFNFLCQNFVRGQGLIANSTSTAANMASLLTGLTPEQHHLQVNDQFIPASHILLPEKLLLRGWRTSFFSGGAPLSRRTQLSQGFETFDESLPLSPKVPHRSFELSTRPFFNWLKEARAKHFAVITVNDLLYPDTVHVSDKGETRPRSLDGQLDELDESFFHFFEELGRQEFGRKSWILIVGLSGRPDPRDSTPAAMQVNPSQMLVPFFIRPPLGLGESFNQNRNEEIEGLWSHAELGGFIEDIANNLDLPLTRRSAQPLQALRDREMPLLKAEGCYQIPGNPVECRLAYFNHQAWLRWQSPLALDQPARRELLAEIRKSSAGDPPPRTRIPTRHRPKAPALEDCLNKFDDEGAFTSFQRLCLSKPILLLRQLAQSRKDLQARPENIREQKVRFIYEWNLLASAHKLYDKFLPTWLFTDLNPRPSEEFLSVETILERPEFRDLQRETARTSPLSGP